MSIYIAASESICVVIVQISIYRQTDRESVVDESECEGRAFANGPGELGSIPGRVILKTFKMVLDTSLLTTRQYKVRIKGKVKQSKERSSALPYTSM